LRKAKDASLDDRFKLDWLSIIENRMEGDELFLGWVA
jgi:hypothetical protein